MTWFIIWLSLAVLGSGLMIIAWVLEPAADNTGESDPLGRPQGGRRAFKLGLSILSLAAVGTLLLRLLPRH